jgi:hypothetical protein
MKDLSNVCKYVWFKAEDKSRNPYAAFRKSFEIKNAKQVETADFYIFADTVYALYVNGKFVGFGPVRFDPRYPQYDCYNLAEYLRDGKNVIAVLANFHGHKVFKSIPAQGAMIAWGQIETGGEVINLQTANNSGWKCRQHLSYGRYTPKLSFALFAQDHYNQGLFDENWAETNYDDSLWPAAVEIHNQNAFGPLTPREIPFMKLDSVMPRDVTIAPLLKTERLYSFYFPVPIRYDVIRDEKEIYSRFICWAAYIYSPRKQTVTAGVLYERLWINGKQCANTQDPIRPLRYNAVMELNEGWNYLFANVDAFQDIYEGYIALPNDKGLILSADKNENSGLLFKYLPLQKIEMDKQLQELTLPLPENFDMKAFGGWAFSTINDSAASPCREASWDLYAPSVEKISPREDESFVVRKDLYPNGFMLTVDMEYMSLVFPRIKMRGVKGCAIDFVYSDRLMANNQHLNVFSWVPLGDRIVCANDTLDWQPVQPRGFRYLGITVRDTPGDVCVNEISFLSAHYPVKRAGSFECSDPLLNRIWEMGAVTQPINMEDVYVDCVDRERGLYALDTLIQYFVNLSCFGDHALMKRSLELYGQSSHESGAFRCLYPNTGHYIIPDFCLYVVNGFYAYYRQTKDIELIKEYWTAIKDNLQVFHKLSDEREDKLLRADNPEENWANRKSNLTGFFGDGERTNNSGINGIFSCLYLKTLRESLEMAEAIGLNESADAADLKQRISILEKSVAITFWNEEKGLFADNTEHADFSPLASLFAVLAGVATPRQKEKLRENIPPLCKPFFKNGYDHTKGMLFQTNLGFIFINGLYKLGLDNVAERCIKDGWGYFITKGLKTTPEHFSINESRCHAWAAYPTYMLSHYVLGIRFDAFSENITINPQPGNLTWAKGTFPHPKGLIEVEWHKESGQIIFDRLSAPEGVTILTS